MSNPTNEPPVYDLAAETIVFDRGTDTIVARLRGIAALPVGAEIELPGRPDTVRVERVRLLAPVDDEPACLCLDVRLPAQLDVPPEEAARREAGTGDALRQVFRPGRRR